ncbi:MAG: ATP synthase F1 subunit delta [Vicingaceae bacterium]
MRDIKVASRYAKSLLKIAIDENSLEDLHKDMVLVNDVCVNNKELTLLLQSPIIKTDKKTAIMNEIFGGKISQIATSFIAIIISKKREGILGDIAASFIETYKNHKNIKTAQVTSAVPLSQDQKDKVVAMLKASSKTEVVDLNEIIDPTIIGGMIVRVGDKQIDESIKRKLTNLEMEFDDNLYISEL